MSSKYAFPPLSENERTTIFSCLFPEGLTYRFILHRGESLLMVRDYQGVSAQSRLLGNLRDLLEKGPCLSLDLSKPKGSNVESLWEALLPYPLSLAGRHFLEDPQVQVGPTPFKAQLSELFRAFSLIEDEARTAEFSCLPLAGLHNSWFLLFHYVHGSRVRVGLTATSPPLLPLRQLSGLVPVAGASKVAPPSSVAGIDEKSIEIRFASW